jgi:hypothetical protein
MQMLCMLLSEMPNPLLLASEIFSRALPRWRPTRLPPALALPLIALFSLALWWALFRLAMLVL